MKAFKEDSSVPKYAKALLGLLLLLLFVFSIYAIVPSPIILQSF